MAYKEIIEKCLTGSPAAQRKLYDKLAPKMFALCLRYCANREDAQDALQEGFIKVFQHLKKYNDLGSFEGWVRKIMVNTSLTLIQKRKNKRTQPDTFLEFIAINTETISNLSANELLDLVKQLPDGYRAVFNLYVIEGYSHKEIAKLLNIKESTSRSQLLKSRKMLRALIHKNEMSL